MESDTNVNSQGGPFGNALQAASIGGHVETVRLLLEMEASTKENMIQTLKIAIKGGDVLVKGFTLVVTLIIARDYRSITVYTLWKSIWKIHMENPLFEAINEDYRRELLAYKNSLTICASTG